MNHAETESLPSLTCRSCSDNSALILQDNAYDGRLCELVSLALRTLLMRVVCFRNISRDSTAVSHKDNARSEPYLSPLVGWLACCEWEIFVPARKIYKYTVPIETITATQEAMDR
jgi:hypothetical protein